MEKQSLLDNVLDGHNKLTQDKRFLSEKNKKVLGNSEKFWKKVGKYMIIVLLLTIFCLFLVGMYMLSLKFPKLTVIIVLCVLLIVLLYKVVKRITYVIDYEPVFTLNYWDLFNYKEGHLSLFDEQFPSFSTMCPAQQDSSSLDTPLLYDIKPSKSGIEFTVRFWLYIKSNSQSSNWRNNFNTEKIIFKLDQNDGDKNGSPILFYNAKKGTLHLDTIVGGMDTRDITDTDSDNNSGNFIGLPERFDIGKVKLQQWCHFAIVFDNRNIDIFYNGELYKSHKLSNVPLIGRSTISFGANGGLHASLAIPKYYNRVVPYNEIYQDYLNHKDERVPREHFLFFWMKCWKPRCLKYLKTLYPMGKLKAVKDDKDVNKKSEDYIVSVVGYSEDEEREFYLKR